ncbi:sulfotransferase [Marimonas sp. MJW-29]|uniref:Sulfotransferase n=1 Tax=Sulfitobacter sediminis TaxID=3234186 RepID=A0ABV3RS88_9RHOB
MIDRLATRMKDVVRDQPVPSRAQFMRANLLAHQGKIAEAARVFKEANAAKHSEISAEVTAESHSWQGTWDTPNPPPLAGRRPGDMPFEVLLLLGPTRSGKSSVEQALAGDPSVLPRYEAINFGLLRAHGPEDLARLPTEERGGLLRQALYLSRVTQDQLAGRIVVCTNPNLVHVVPALLALVGRLNIVWIDRGGPGHMADIFASDYVDGNFYAYDIDNITSYLSAYAKRMSELMKALPDQAIRVAFADFLNDPAAQIGRIAALVGRPLVQGGVPDAAAARRHCAYTEDLARHLL